MGIHRRNSNHKKKKVWKRCSQRLIIRKAKVKTVGYHLHPSVGKTRKTWQWRLPAATGSDLPGGARDRELACHRERPSARPGWRKHRAWSPRPGDSPQRPSPQALLIRTIDGVWLAGSLSPRWGPNGTILDTQVRSYFMRAVGGTGHEGFILRGNLGQRGCERRRQPRCWP